VRCKPAPPTPVEEDQPKRDVLVFRRLQIAAQLVGGKEQLRLEAELAAIAVLFRAAVRGAMSVPPVSLW
jgi:hypothetical protein